MHLIPFHASATETRRDESPAVVARIHLVPSVPSTSKAVGNIHVMIRFPCLGFRISLVVSELLASLLCLSFTISIDSA